MSDFNEHEKAVMAEAIENKRRREEWERYHETKRLAEMGWESIVGADFFMNRSDGDIAGLAWIAAEAMHAESERRRPQE